MWTIGTVVLVGQREWVVLVEIRSKALARAFVRLHLSIFVVNELFQYFPF